MHYMPLFMASGLSPEDLTRQYKLYFDETNNAKMFHLKDDNRLNVPVGVRFVLGGISSNQSLTQEELNKALNLQKNSKELKFEQIYGHASWDDFEPVLRSSRLIAYLNLLNEKNGLIHFGSVNLFYFALVDIIDSLDFNRAYVFGLKSILYQIAQQVPEQFVQLFQENTYPDVKDVDKFMEELIDIVDNTTIEEQLGKQVLLKVLKNNYGRLALTFIQDEEENMYIKDFLPFYQEPLYKFAYSNIILDNEIDMKEGLEDCPVEVNGKKVNYQFVDSQSEPWVQMSDVAASLVARYLCFVENDDYEKRVAGFSQRQMDNFTLLNRILAASERENKLFWHFTEDMRIVQRFSDCVMRFQ